MYPSPILIGGVLARVLGFQSVIWGIRNSGPGSQPYEMVHEAARSSMRTAFPVAAHDDRQLSERARDIHVAKGYERESSW